jgi:hypothetical protein
VDDDKDDDVGVALIHFKQFLKPPIRKLVLSKK